MSEALNKTLSLDNILEIIVSTTLRETNADIAACSDNPSINASRCAPAALGKGTIRPGSRGAQSQTRFSNTSAKTVRCCTHGNRASRFFAIFPRASGWSRSSACRSRSGSNYRDAQRVLLYARNKFSEGQRKMLSILADRASSAIDNARLFQNLQDSFQQNHQGFARAMEAKDPYTHGHSDRVMHYCRLIAQGLSFNESRRISWRPPH